MSKEAVVTYSRRKRRSPSNDAEEEEKETAVQQHKSPAVTLISPSAHKYKQYFLDFGQLDFSYSTCKICGLLYARGNSEDEKLHALFHKRYVRGVLFKGWQKERLVVKDEKDDERIILVLPSDPPQHQLKVKELVQIMEKDLGVEPGWLLHGRCKVYMYISSKKVIGCAVTEPISEAYPVVSENEPTATTNTCMRPIGLQNKRNQLESRPCCATNGLLCDRDEGGRREWLNWCQSSGEGASQLEQEEEEEVGRARKRGAKTMVFGDVKFQRERVGRCNVQKNPVLAPDDDLPAMCTKHPVAAACGIRGLWVSKSERRRGIATHLMEAIRTSFIYGLILDASQCAFSQPTPQGKAFAAKYSQTDRYLVYS